MKIENLREKIVEYDDISELQYLWERVKQIKYCVFVRVRRRNPKSEWGYKEVKPAMKLKENMFGVKESQG